MGQRTGASSSCEDLVLEISLPDEPMAADKMALTLHEKEVDLGTTLYRLKLPLPHPVDVESGKKRLIRYSNYGSLIYTMHNIHGIVFGV